MFASIRENQHKLYRGPVSDSTHQREWHCLRLLYPAMCPCREWQCRPTGPSPSESGHGIPEEDEEEDGFISDLAFSEDGRNLLAASSSGRAYLFDPNMHRLLFSVNVSSDPTLKVKFVSSRNFITASADNVIRLWDVRDLRKPVNALRGHKNLIRSLDYEQESCMLISSSYDCSVRYWHLPSYQLGRREGEPEEEVDSEESSGYRGVLFACPDLNQVTVSWCSRKLLCINSKGVIFVVSNLDTTHLKEDVKFAQFNSTLPLLLSWILPNTSSNRRNSLKIIDSNDYNTSPQYSVSKIHHLDTHPHLPVAMIRFSSSHRTQYSNRSRDLTSVYKLDHAHPVSDVCKLDMVKAYGTDIMEENLLFCCEQARYCTMFEKKPSFSSCGRVIASPEKNCVKILAFSQKLDMPISENSITTAPRTLSNVIGASVSNLWASREPNGMVTVASIPREVDSAMCTRFSSPASGLVLAVGESGDRVSFHQPRL